MTVCLADQLTVDSSLAVPAATAVVAVHPECVRAGESHAGAAAVQRLVHPESAESAWAAAVQRPAHPESAVRADVAVHLVRQCTTSLAVHSVQLPVVHYHRVPDWPDLLDSVVPTVTGIDDASLRCSVVAPEPAHSAVVVDYQHSVQVGQVVVVVVVVVDCYQL